MGTLASDAKRRERRGSFGAWRLELREQIQQRLHSSPMKLLKSIGLIAGQMTKLKSSVEASPTNMPRKKIFIFGLGATRLARLREHVSPTCLDWVQK